MNKRIRFLAAVLALCMALTLGLCGCTPKTESRKDNAPAREGVSTYGAEENLAPDGTPFETVYVPGIMEFDRSLGVICQFKTSPNGLCAYDDLAETLYEFDPTGHCLKEWDADWDDFNALSGGASDGWRIEMHENKEDYYNQSIDYRVLYVQDGQETEIMSFRDEHGTTGLVGGEDFFLLYHVWWDESNEGHFVLESYGRDAALLHTQELSEWMEIYRTDTGIYFLGRDSYDILRYDPASFSLNKVDSVPDGCRTCGIAGDTLYLTDNIYLYRHKLGSGESEALFRYDRLFLNGTAAPVPIGGTDSFFFRDYSNWSSPYRVAYPVDKNSLPAEKTIITLAINEEIPEQAIRGYGSYHDQITDFNTVNREYEIVVRNYAESPDPFLALTADMAGGNAPDLIDVRGFGSAICSASTAEDLLPYVERDLGTDAFLPGPLAAMETDGKLLSLMPSFSLTAILGPATLLEGQSIKSFSELSDLAGGAEHVFYRSVDRDTFMKWVFAGNHRDYTAQQVADYLTFAAALPEDATQNPYGLTEQELKESLEHGDVFPLDYGPICEGQQLFELAGIADPLGRTEHQDAASIPEAEGWFGRRLSAIGLPGAKGSGVYLSPNQELMMPLAAQNKEGAWSFLAFLLNDRYLITPFSGGFRYGIPLTRSAYDREIGQYWAWMDGKLSGSINGADYELAYDADNCKALFLSLLDQVDGICRDGDEIFDAVMTTANSYFAGDKPLNQAADDIAKRLKIYNAEQN